MDEIAQYFTRMAPAFDSYYREAEHGFVGRVAHEVFRKPGLVRRFEATMALLEPIAGRRILDVGCGPGAFSVYLWGRGAEVTGIDLAPAMVELARRNAADAGWLHPDLRVGDAMTFTSDVPFDACIAIGVFDYLSGHVRTAFLERLCRLSAGPVIASFPKLYTPQSPVRRLYFVGKETPVYFYTGAMLSALARHVDRVVTSVNCGPIWTASFSPAA